MLTEPFYQQPTLDLARSLLGRNLVRMYEGQHLVGRIVEVEAYHQDGDRAAHCYGGQTARNAVMFGPPGRLYIYFIYGMHYCMNVVSEPAGTGAAVLIRALEPLEGIQTMRRLRGSGIKDRDLTNGPAKCCKAMGLDGFHNNSDLMSTELFLEGGGVDAHLIVSGPRIGISKSVELPWRFHIKDNPHVSKSRPGPPKRGRYVHQATGRL